VPQCSCHEEVPLQTHWAREIGEMDSLYTDMIAITFGRQSDDSEDGRVPPRVPLAIIKNAKHTAGERERQESSEQAYSSFKIDN